MPSAMSPQAAKGTHDFLPASTAEDIMTDDVQLTELCKQCSGFNFADFFPSTSEDDSLIVMGKSIDHEWHYRGEDARCLMCETIVAAISAKAGVDQTLARSRSHRMFLKKPLGRSGVVELHLQTSSRHYGLFTPCIGLLDIYRSLSSPAHVVLGSWNQGLLQSTLNIPLLKS